MLSYKDWKNLNESILPSFNLGIGGPQKISLQNNLTGEVSEDPVEGQEEETLEEKSCNCGKNCGKFCGKKMWKDEDDAPEDSDEKDSDEKDSDEKDSDEKEDSDEKDSEKSKKQIKKEASEQDWWNSVNQMISDTDFNKKYDDGWSQYQTIDQDDLKVTLRDEPSSEPGPGEVGFAPSGKLGEKQEEETSEELSEAVWTYAKGGLALKDQNGKPKIFSTLEKANVAAESVGGKAMKHGDGFIVVKYDVPAKLPDNQKSFHSAQYQMPGDPRQPDQLYGRPRSERGLGDNEEAKRPLNIDMRRQKLSKRKPLEK